MKKYLLMLTWLGIGHLALSQTITSYNFRHLYDPDQPFEFQLSLMKGSDEMAAQFVLKLKKNAPAGAYLVQFEKRDSYLDRKGEILHTDTTQLQPGEVAHGSISIKPEEKPWLLLVQVQSQTTGIASVYFQIIESNYPVIAGLYKDNTPLITPFAKTGIEYALKTIEPGEILYGYRYTTRFTSAMPPFAVKSAIVDPVMLPDSTFSVHAGQPIQFDRDALYLLQHDTTKAEGYAFRVASGSFPRYSTIEDLVGPLVYVTTKDEFDDLVNAKGDKTKFDKVILDITRDKDRARNFMRGYYQRVELANLYFSSYKEGWKTDRGMVYIIFGLPDNVTLSNQTEIWYYKNTRTRFIFVKQGSIYDPNNYILQRSKSFSELWYNAVDLWRKSRY